MYCQVKENFISSEEQTVIKTNRPFIDNTVDVYLNGEKKEYDIDFTSNGEESEIIFYESLPANGIIDVLSTSDDIDKVVSFGSKDTDNTLYKRYESDNTLKYNNKYKIHLVIDNQVYEYSFSSALTPMYSSSKKIFEDVGEFIDGFTEEYINSIIHRNSVEIVEKVNAKIEDNADNIAIENTITADADGYYDPQLNKLLNKWVRLKTDIDLVYARYYGIAANYGSQEKSIGDIRIAKDVKLPYIDELLKKLKKDLDDVEQKLFGTVIASTAVRAGNKYPYSELRTSW